MFAPLRRGGAACVGIALAALFAACSGSTLGTPSAAAQPPAASASTVGSTDAPASSTGDTDASCTIVTSDAVAQAVGFAIATTSGAGGICYYQNADPSKYLMVQLFATQADMSLMLQIEPGNEHVAGLGDDAFWVAVGGILFVRKGDRGIEFLDPDSSFGAGGSASRDALVTLARTAVPKL